MPSGPCRIVFAALVAISLSWVVPAHHGAHAIEPASADSAHHDHDDADGEDHDSSHDSSHCSICLFSGKLTTPDVLHFNVLTLELLEIVPAHATLLLEPLDFIRTFYGRGPPPIA